MTTQSKNATIWGIVPAAGMSRRMGFPKQTAMMGGLDSLLATVQMPGDVPVATVGAGMGGPRNAGLLAVQILALSDDSLQAALVQFKKDLVGKVAGKNEKLQATIREENA